MKGDNNYMEHQQHHHQNRQPKHELTPQHQGGGGGGGSIFSKLQAPPHHQHQHQHQHQHLPFSPHNPFHHENDPTDPAQSTPKPPAEPTSGDGASIEVVRRPRGRPPGSKNKPKPPVIITREPSEPAMSPYILEVPGGNDVVEALSRFCRRKGVGICVLTGSGTVSNVTLRQPSTAPAGSTVTFHGRFDILSLSAAFIPPAVSGLNIPNSFTISLAGPQGQVVGGIVAGSLVAAGTVYVIAATFTNPSYHRLSGMEGEETGRAGNNNNNNSLSGGSGGEGQSPGVSVSGSRGESGGGEQGGMYGCHLGGGSDVVWAPTARPPPPPY